MSGGGEGGGKISANIAEIVPPVLGHDSGILMAEALYKRPNVLLDHTNAKVSLQLSHFYMTRNAFWQINLLKIL